MAKLSCAIAGMMWGLLWMPLRALNEIGVGQSWSLVLFYTIPMLIVIPVILWRWNYVKSGGWRLQLVGLVLGFTLFIYSLSFLYTDVVRALVLFYMTPVWSAILARIFLKDTITPIRVVAIVIGMLGMLIIFGIEDGIPAPQNVGDWLGLAAGFMWAVATVLMRKNQSLKAFELTGSYSIWIVVSVLIYALLPISPEMPDIAVVSDVLYWLIPVTLLVVLPAGFTMMWGAPLLSPAVTALLLMT
ncbi:MAG: DMT family transporter, partial [Rhodospirillales bacterium]|nr:DMT family transporter [Rhodospirillales bacterium]